MNRPGGILLQRQLLALILAIAVPLAGCLGGDEPPATPQAASDETASEEPGVDTGSPMDAAVGGSGPGSRAHKHDYWAGRTEVILVDTEFTPNPQCGWPEGQLSHGCIFVGMGNGSVVYQGTSKLTLTATWNDPATTGVRLQYQDAKAFHDEGTQLTSGTPHEIAVDMETADMAHSKESKWMFALLGGGSGPVGTLEGPVHVTITIYRGLDLPLDPPHPDFWGNATTIELANLTTTLPPETGDFLIFIYELERVALPEGVIVPPGTERLEINYWYTVKDPAPGVSYWILPFWKSAQGPFWTAERDDRSEGTGEGHYEILVEPEMTDSPYAKESQWGFAFPQTQNEPTTGTELPISYFGTSPLNREIELTLQVIAHGGHSMDAMAEEMEA